MIHRRRLPRPAPAALFCLVLALALVGCSGGEGKGGAPKAAPPGKPNIVFVLTDDLSWNLIAHMPQVRDMQAKGLTFDNFFVADSLCCTSRSTILTGKYPHNTGVRTNFPPDGGYRVFKAHGGEQASFGAGLQGAGYRTAFLGKYLNGYQPGDRQGGPAPYVPPGWSEWYVTGNGYPEYNYNLNENGRLVHHGQAPQDYLTDVLSGKADDFVRRAAAAGKPFFMEVATFAPHGPFVPAPRHAGALPGVRAPRTPAFNEADVGDKPSWLRARPSLRSPGLQGIERGFRDRARMVQAVDEMIARLRRTLAAKGLDKDTYLVFGSDNGFHMGEHRLAGGKMTAFDTDIRVPYVVVGPGVEAGGRTGAIVQNTDLAPTFLDIAGAAVPPATDGRSLVPFLRGARPPDWRTAALVEHVKPPPSPQDPDRQDSSPGAPPTYNALRLPDALYVEYQNGEREYYDMTRDPHQLDNLGGRLQRDRRRQLSALLYALTHCSGAGCMSAGRTR
ncbi:sulfatase [Actinomadura sp. NEAU-AAG7]|uniref:sulfatase family protein n=1 Tax=Actinomadura sp. NEAU-AAG7 TaxID=2839640 RepID=UPI001BE3E147|nr:sulfatase [Actinomadura sp. NEAU-AAG7]MBT2208181.1 sulfatase [Actinomadura sp. NEAU-AAG7]